MNSSVLLRGMTSLVSHLTGRRLTVLTYHNVRNQVAPPLVDEINTHQFTERLRWLGQVATILPLDEALATLDSGKGNGHLAAITFDDGYVTNLTVALPVLRQLGLHATFFVLPGLLGRSLWTEDVRDALRLTPLRSLDLRDLGGQDFAIDGVSGRQQVSEAVVAWMKELPDAHRRDCVRELLARCDFVPAGQQLMNETQLRELANAGMEIGSHSMSHPMLARASDAVARQEIVQSRQAIADITGRPARYFAYPNGRPGIDYAARDAELVQAAGYAAAFNTGWGSISPSANRFDLPRFTPWDDSSIRFQMRLGGNVLRSPTSGTA